ncbi:MAG: acyl-[acyl-carrier-protein] thioesterase [Roseburia sp.]
MYILDGRVRYSEVDSEQRMTVPALLNYFQDCCTFQSEDLGLGVDYLKEQKKAWMLTAWQVYLNRTPKLGETIKVKTWPYDFKGFYGYRNFVLEDQAGEICAYADTVWIFMDLAAGRPVRVTEEMLQAYAPEQKIDMPDTARKLTMPEPADPQPSILVTKAQIDTNHHVNNEQYVAIAQQYLPEEAEIRQLRVEYKKAAVLDDVIYPAVNRNENTVSVSLADEAGKPYALVQFDLK